jgi:hypothetical protein
MRRLFVSCGLLGALLLGAGCGGKDPAPAAGTGSSGSGDSGAAGSTDVELGDASTAPPTAGEAPQTPSAPATTPPATTQTPSAGASSFDGLDLNRVTADDAVALVIRPAQAFKNPIVQKVLAEIEQSNPDFNVKRELDEMRERLGVDASEVESVLVVVSRDQLALVPMILPMMMMGGPPPGFQDEPLAPATPVEILREEKNCDEDSSCDDPLALPPEPKPPLVFVKFSHPVDPHKLTEGRKSNEEQHAGKTIYLQPEGPAAFTLLGDGSLVAFGDAAKIREVIDGKPTQAGPLAENLKPMLGHEYALVLDVRPLHDFLSQMFQQNPNPMAVMAGGLVKQVNTLTLTADLTGPNLLQLDLHAINDNSAKGLQGMLGGLLDSGKQQYSQVTAMKADEIPESQKAIKPLVDSLVNGSKVVATGSVCSFTVPRPEGVEKLPELLKPLLADMKVRPPGGNRLSQLRRHLPEVPHARRPRRRRPAGQGTELAGPPAPLPGAVSLVPAVPPRRAVGQRAQQVAHRPDAGGFWIKP